MTYPNPAHDPLNRPSSSDVPWLFSEGPNTAQLILALPMELRDLIWHSLVDLKTDYLTWWPNRKLMEDNYRTYRGRLHPYTFWKYCTECWAAEATPFIAERPFLALLRVNKFLNVDIKRFLCGKFDRFQLRNKSCFWEYMATWQARGPLSRAHEISLRMGDMSEALAEWEVHAILQGLGKEYRTGLGVGDKIGAGEWMLVRKVRSGFKRGGVLAGGWEVVLRREEI